jgi:serine/threonine-protein kinase
MTKIKLPNGTFEYDPAQPLGKRGGFGQVFIGRTNANEEVAVKKLHVSATDAGHRELQVADELRGRSFEHVIAFIDAGEDADSGEYFLVMPKADGSLQELINKGTPLSTADTAAVMCQVAKGLQEVNDLVHRDLKPDNILSHQGKWKVADFGIARFVTEATSSKTLKGCGSEGYAAPEQWRLERATHATDVYALGCIGFCLLTGKPPFTLNPQEEHQTAPVPDFKCEDNRLKALIKHMLRKPPESRPNLSCVETVLSEIVSKPFVAGGRDSFAALAAAGAEIADREQQEEARQKAEQKACDERNRLAVVAFEILSDNVERLWGIIHNTAISARRSGTVSGLFEVQLGAAVLRINVGGQRSAIGPGEFRFSGWDVVAGCEAHVWQKNPKYKWSASL